MPFREAIHMSDLLVLLVISSILQGSEDNYIFNNRAAWGAKICSYLSPSINRTMNYSK